jgi:SAM-dependent methyltransferase
MVTNKKLVRKMWEWAKVTTELKGEDLKQKIYDNVLVDLCGDVKGKKILDYGAGPAVVAKRVSELGAKVHVYDISKEMREIAASVLGQDSVFEDVVNIPKSEFDIVLCNLVLCIVPEQEVLRIIRNIGSSLKEDGKAYVGFCNPLIFDLPESVIDYRFQTGDRYFDNHDYKKKKKEGNYEIIELHRPIEWYTRVFREAGMRVHEIHFTPEYDVNGRVVSDFVIFELRRD